MEFFKKMKNRTIVFVLAMLCATAVMGSSNAHAYWYTWVNGVKITYTYPNFSAYYDAGTNAIVVTIGRDFGNLGITASSEAQLYAPYADIYINSNYYYINKLTMKGYYNRYTDVLTPLYVAGQVYQAKTASLTYGHTGYLSGIDPTMGLGASYTASKIAMTYSSAMYSFLGLDYGGSTPYSAAKANAATAPEAIESLKAEKLEMIRKMKEQLKKQPASAKDESID